MKQLWVVDINWIVQLYHHSKNVGTLEGIKELFDRILTERNPDFLLCAADCDGPTFRHELLGSYKSNRPEKSVELLKDISSVSTWLNQSGIRIEWHKGFEADDVMATYAYKCVENGMACCIVSCDKDMRQCLVNKRVGMYLRKKTMEGMEWKFLTQSEAEEEWGVKREQFIEFQMMCGDGGDTVDGIKKVGPKAAAQLLNTYGSLDGVFENIDDIGGKRHEYIKEFQERSALVRQLITLRTDVPVLGLRGAKYS